MIKAVSHGPNGPVIILGLTEMNVDRMKADMPIVVNLPELGLEGKVIIVYGKDEDTITAALKDKVAIGQFEDRRPPKSKN